VAYIFGQLPVYIIYWSLFNDNSSTIRKPTKTLTNLNINYFEIVHNDSIIYRASSAQRFIIKIIEKLQFITLLTAICIVSHIENSKNDKGYIT